MKKMPRKPIPCSPSRRGFVKCAKGFTPPPTTNDTSHAKGFVPPSSSARLVLGREPQSQSRISGKVPESKDKIGGITNKNTNN